MLKKITLILFGLSFITITGCKISGTVTLDGVGIEGVTVVLNTDPDRSAETDSHGKYTFNSVKAGDYTVTIEPPDGYTRFVSRSVVKELRSMVNVNFALESDTIRSTETGDVIGFKEDNSSHVWLGIPFAAPPVDDLRWKAPVPADSWGNDTYLALEHCDDCSQTPSEIEKALGAENVLIGSEDCLYLNIHAPAFTAENIPDGTSRLPVMVWIHGGSNMKGGGSRYNGKNLADKYDLVVVTINYRLGLLGWFSHPALESGNIYDDSGNFGTLDMIRALTWVRDNIENFGGDSGNVTIFGQSAGAWNTLSLMLSKEAEGLFHRAISQSGGAETYDMSFVQNYIEDDGYSNSAREILNNILIEDNIAVDRVAARMIQEQMTNEDIQAYLYSKTNYEILNAFSRQQISPTDEVNDGVAPISVVTKFRDGVVLPAGDPSTLFNDTADYNAVPLMIGSTRDEYKNWMAGPEFVKYIGDFPIPVGANDPAYYALYAGYKSDVWKILGVDCIASKLSENPGQPDIYAYRFDWDEEPTILTVDFGLLIGAAHGMEISFVFNYFKELAVSKLTPLVFTKKNLPGRQKLGNSMSSYWAEFAYSGSPGFGRMDSETVEWQAWNNTLGKEKIMIFDTNTDGGIRMHNTMLTFEGLKDRLLSETDFPTQEQHCSMYMDLFYGSDLWKDEEYANIGAEG